MGNYFCTRRQNNPTKDRFDAVNELFFREQVEKPFSSSDQAADLGPAWRSAREQYLRTATQQLETDLSELKFVTDMVRLASEGIGLVTKIVNLV